MNLDELDEANKSESGDQLYLGGGCPTPKRIRSLAELEIVKVELTTTKKVAVAKASYELTVGDGETVKGKLAVQIAPEECEGIFAMLTIELEKVLGLKDA